MLICEIDSASVASTSETVRESTGAAVGASASKISNGAGSGKRVGGAGVASLGEKKRSAGTSGIVSESARSKLRIGGSAIGVSSGNSMVESIEKSTGGGGG
jgi:hypothetical protein